MDRIVDATVAAIESGGEPALRVNDIARESNVSVATLYHYFGDREGLVVAARVKQYLGSTAVYLDDFARAVGELTSPEQFSDLVKIFFDRSIAVANRKQRFLRAEILGSSRTRPLLAASCARSRKTTCADSPLSLESRRSADSWRQISIHETSPNLHSSSTWDRYFPTWWPGMRAAASRSVAFSRY